MHENMNIKPLTGTVEKKLDKFGDIIYAFGSERFGVEKRKEKVQTTPGMLDSSRKFMG